MQVLRLTPDLPLWNALTDYAGRCGWVAGPHLAQLLREKRFSDWESPFAAVAGGRIIGFCTLLKTDYYPENRYRPWISSIFVDESFRSQRVCGQLIAAACEAARDAGFTRVFIPSDMTGFYERYGFARIDTLVNYGGDTDSIFARDLVPAGGVSLVRASIADADVLQRMKHAAFWPVYERYHDDAISPALEMLSKVRAQLESPATDWYILRCGKTDVGGMRIVRERAEDGSPVCRISPLFVLPEHQRQGVASAALKAAFSLYPEAALWRISAILQEYDTCCLYERHCFRRTETEPTPYPGMDIVHFTRLREDVPMRRLARLTDRELLGTDAVSHAAPRLTARAILQGCGERAGLCAVTHTKDFGIHMLPGGGIESGESILQALHREVYEETGCRIASARPLGYVEENRGHADYTQLSFYFLCTTADTELHPHLTQTETAHGATALWMTPEEMRTAICTPVFIRPQSRFLQARDMAALKACMAEPDPANALGDALSVR